MAACKKIKYDSRKEAADVLLKIKSEERYSEKEKQEKSFYECPLCGGWHITSKSESDREDYKREAQRRRASRIHLAANYWIEKLRIKDKK